MLFKDRQEAGYRLAQALQKYHSAENVLILSLPRGGVVVGAEIAKVLKLPHDIVVPRKIGAPGNPEFAIGAVTETGEGIFDKATIDGLGVSEEYIKSETEKEIKEAKRRLMLYRGEQPTRVVTNKTIIIVDDGLATGATMRAAIASIKKEKPRKIVVAVPVAPQDTIEKIKQEVDEVICLEIPLFFGAVGAFYENFSQVSDQEVIELLR